MSMVPQTAAEEALGLSLPSRRDEAWKWTDLRRLLTASYATTTPEVDDAIIDKALTASAFSHLNLDRIVLVNGKINRERSDLDKFSLSQHDGHSEHLQGTIVELNKKLSPEGNVIVFEGNVDRPVEVLHITVGDHVAVPSLLHVEVSKGASATLLESHYGVGTYLHSPVTTVTLHDGSRLDRIKIERESAHSQHLADTTFWLGKAAILNDFTLTAGAELSRQNVHATLLGENSVLRIAGSYLLASSQHVDTALVVDHAVPNCQSRELFKCVMDDKSRGIFQGKVIVRKDAQKIDGKQSSHALLLSETAEFDAKPELEIYADDVVCGHGTTCGDLNQDHLFYLKSRGIPELEARAMLVEAFVAEAIETVENESVRDALMALLHVRMGS
jgi:Fe-S cluster assembly protein SufD